MKSVKISTDKISFIRKSGKSVTKYFKKLIFLKTWMWHRYCPHLLLPNAFQQADFLSHSGNVGQPNLNVITTKDIVETVNKGIKRGKIMITESDGWIYFRMYDPYIYFDSFVVASRGGKCWEVPIFLFDLFNFSCKRQL